jgi:glycosyltransferase involved in cell wall biosynthesis
MELLFSPGLKRKIVVIPSGVEEPAVAPNEIKEFKAKYNLDYGDPVILSVGVFSWDWKVAGLLLLLESFPAVVKEFPAARLVIVGDGRYSYLIKAKVEELALKENVILTGNLKNTFVPLAASGIYCHLALNESGSVSILEAMICGKPIVVSRAGGNPELIVSEKNGLVVEPDRACVEAAMLRLARDSAFSGALGMAARAGAAELYKWPAIARQYLKLYSNRS